MKGRSPLSFARKLALLALLLAPTAAAQLNITGPRDLTLAPGSETRITYQVSNDLPTAVDAILFFQDVLQLPDGAITYLDAGSLPASIHPLLTFEASEVQVPPNGSVTVPVTVRVPEDATGGYWGVIGVDTRPDPLQQNQVGLRVRYAMVTKLDVEGKSTRLVRLHDLQHQVSEQGSFIVFTLENAGDTYERPHITAEFHTAQGAAGATERAFVVHPGNLLEARLPLPDSLPEGSYGVRLTVRLDGQAPEQYVLTITHR